MIEGYENNLSVAQRWDEPLRNITPKNLRPPVPRGSSLADGKFDELGLKVIDDAATRLVAEKIIELSQHGMRGVATLHAMTVRQFKTE